MPVCSHVPHWIQEFCDYKFVKDHVACGECAEAKCNENKQHRGVSTATVLVYDHATWLRLKSEVVGKQGTYVERTIYETLEPNVCQYYERQKKRAKGPFTGRFKYAVKKSGSAFYIYHFDGVVGSNAEE